MGDVEYGDHVLVTRVELEVVQGQISSRGAFHAASSAFHLRRKNLRQTHHVHMSTFNLYHTPNLSSEAHRFQLKRRYIPHVSRGLVLTKQNISDDLESSSARFLPAIKQDGAIQECVEIIALQGTSSQRREHIKLSQQSGIPGYSQQRENGPRRLHR